MRRNKFAWEDEADAAFCLMKECLTTTPVLALPDFTHVFEVHTYASKVGIGALLSQQDWLVAFFIEKLWGARLNYNTYDIEFYIVVQAIKRCRHFLIHREFV